MTPIRKWKMIGDGVLSEHLKICEFNQERDKIIRSEKFKVMENLGGCIFLCIYITKTQEKVWELISDSVCWSEYEVLIMYHDRGGGGEGLIL